VVEFGVDDGVVEGVRPFVSSRANRAYLRDRGIACTIP
jgi:hypothetical protein